MNIFSSNKQSTSIKRLLAVMLSIIVICSYCWRVSNAATNSLTTKSQQSIALHQRQLLIIQFAKKMHHQHGFNQARLTTLLSKVQPSKKLLRQINQPYEKKPWYQYQTRFLDKQRISMGRYFWLNHKASLALAWQRYQVPASIIVAIIGIETNYGKTQGKRFILNTLTNLSFSGIRRSKFFRHELTQFLLLCRHNGYDSETVKGSYAGAMGIPQFMPSSYQRYAVAYKNKHVNLMNNTNDAIMSVANYLNQHGWQGDMPTATLTTATKDFTVTHAQKTVAEWQKLGIINQQPLAASTPVRIIRLAVSPTRKQLYMVNNNFKAILQYNYSNHYAMAVVTLAKAIKKAKQ